MRRIYPEAGVIGKLTRLFVMTGQRRPPVAGEWYLSGAIPEAYLALADLNQPLYILRELRHEETICSACQQALPVAGRGGHE